MSIFRDIGIASVEVSSSLEKKLEDTRVQLMLASPLFSYLLPKVNEIGFSRYQPTAFAVVHDDLSGIYFNDMFFDRLSIEECTFVLYHELSHIYKKHVERQHDFNYNNERWNRATDYEINLEASGVFLDEKGNIVFNKRYQKYMKMPVGGLFNKKYLGLSSDEIYEMLDDSDEETEEHFFGNGGSGDLLARQAHDMESATTFADIISRSEIGVGSDVGERLLIKKFRELFKPTVDWASLFHSSIDSTVKERNTYSKYSPLTVPGNGVIFPAKKGRKIRLAFAVDTSGSMTDDDTLRAVSELDGIINSYDDWEIVLFCCDAAAYAIGSFSMADGLTVQEICKELKGGGGTLLSPVLKEVDRLVDDEDQIFNAVVIITDGYISPGDIDDSVNPDIMTIVVVTKAQQLNFKKAVTIHVK